MGTNDPDDGDDTRTPAEDEADAGTPDRPADDVEGQGNATQDTGPSQAPDGHSGGGQPQGQPTGGHQQAGGQSGDQYQRGGGQQIGGQYQQGGGQYQQGGGQPQGQPGGYQQQQYGSNGLDPNVAGALCYVLGWISGLFFLITEDEDEFVRFHAAQSIVVFGGLTVLWVVLSMVLTSLLFSAGVGAFALFNAIATLLQLAGLVAWLVLMFMAYDGRWFEVPIAAGLAYDLSSKRNQPVQQRPPQQPPQ